MGFMLLWLICAFQTDNGALFIGSLIGKTKLSKLVNFYTKIQLLINFKLTINYIYIILLLFYLYYGYSIMIGIYIYK